MRKEQSMNIIKKIFLSLIPVLLLFLSSTPADSSPGFKPGESLNINTSETYLRNRPKSFGVKILKILERGTEVSFLLSKGAWIKVDYRGLEGFIPRRSLVTTKKFKKASQSGEVYPTDIISGSKGLAGNMEKFLIKKKKLVSQAESQSTVENPLQATVEFRKEGKLGEFHEE